MRLLDTDIMIDILRGYGPAVEWLRSLGDEEIGIPGYVAMELVDGCKSRGQAELDRVEDMIERSRTYWPSDEDCQRALDHFKDIVLTHGTSPFDVLIGECAVGMGVPLYSFNVSDFDSIPDLSLEQPYLKTAP